MVQICASNLFEIGGGVLGQWLFYGQVNNAQTAEIVCKPQNSQHNFCTGYFSEHVVILPFSNRPFAACAKKSTTKSISSADISLPLNYPP